MRIYKLTITVVILCTAIVTGAAVLQNDQKQSTSRKQNQSTTRQGAQDIRSHWPIAEYKKQKSNSTTINSTENTGSTQSCGVRRGKHNKRHNNSEFMVSPGNTVAVIHNHWFNNLPALPTAQSSAIVVGEVATAQAYLSEDTKGVSTEFNVKIEEVLKNDGSIATSPGNMLTIERLGGRVKLPDGTIGQYWVAGQEMPKVGQRYVMFLKSDSPEQAPTILTGYAIRNGLMAPLDEAVGTFQGYQGKAEATFLNELREAIAAPPTTPSK